MADEPRSVVPPAERPTSAGNLGLPIVGLPARLLGGTAIQITRQGLGVTVSLDIGKLDEQSGLDPAQTWVPAWTESGHSFRVPINIIPADAPLDGALYGRQNGAWVDTAVILDEAKDYTDEIADITMANVITGKTVVTSTDCGITGDGSDETAAINAGFVKAAAEGKAFRFKKGTYCYSALDVPAIRIEGGGAVVRREMGVVPRDWFVNFADGASLDELTFEFTGTEQGTVPTSSVLKAGLDFDADTIRLISDVQLGYINSLNGLTTLGVGTRLNRLITYNMDYSLFVDNLAGAADAIAVVNRIEARNYLRTFYSRDGGYIIDEIIGRGRSSNADAIGALDGGRYISNLAEGTIEGSRVRLIDMEQSGHLWRFGGKKSKNVRFGTVKGSETRGTAFKVAPSALDTPGVTQTAEDIYVDTVEVIDCGDGVGEGNRDIVRITHGRNVEIGKVSSYPRKYGFSGQTAVLLNDCDYIRIHETDFKNANSGLLVLSKTSDVDGVNTFAGPINDVIIGSLGGNTLGTNIMAAENDYSNIEVNFKNADGTMRLFAVYGGAVGSGKMRLTGSLAGAGVPVVLAPPANVDFYADLERGGYHYRGRLNAIEAVTPKATVAAGDGVTNDQAALAAWLAAPGDKLGDRDVTYLMSSGYLSAAKSVDMRGATLKITRPDRSANDAVTLSDFRNGNILVDIPEPVNPAAPTDPNDPNFLRRVMRIAKDGGVVENARFTSAQYLIIAPVGGGFPGTSFDAFLRLDGARTTVRDVIFDKIEAPILALTGDVVRIERVEFNRARRGVVSKPEVQRLIVSDCVYRSKSLYAFTNPGNNFLTGSPAIAEVSKCLIQGTGEHSIYLSCAYELPGLIAVFDDITIAGYSTLVESGATLDAGPGQCGIKLRNYGRVSINGATVQDCAADNSTGTNEDSFHIEYCDDVMVTASRGIKKVKAACANVGVYLQGVRKAYLGDLYFDAPLEAGVHIQEFPTLDAYVARPCADIVGRDIVVRGGVGLKISHATQEIGAVDIQLTVIDAPGAPIDLSGLGTIAAGKTVRVSGRYSAAAAPIFPDSVQVDVADFVPMLRETTSSVGTTRAIAHLASDVITFTTFSGNMTSMGPAPRGAVRRIRNTHTAQINIPTTPQTTLQVGEQMTVRGAGGTTWLVDARTGIQVVSAASLALAANAINVTDKFNGKVVQDVTNTRLLYALGPAPTDGWRVVDGSATVTPA